MANIPAIKAELLADHPITGPYDADNATATLQINAVNIVRNRTSMSGREIASHIDAAEYEALSDAKKAHIISLQSSSDINPSGFAQHVVIGVFGLTSDTVTALNVARVETVSQATAKELGTIYQGHIEAARA